MGAKVLLVTGPAGSGKTRRLLAEYREALATGPVGGALWLGPARRNIELVRGSLLGPGLAACFRPQCYTFGQFAIHTLAAAETPPRALDRLGQREILRRLAAGALQAGRLRHFGSIADTPGFLDLLASFIREFKRLDIWPDALAERAGDAGRRRAEPKLLELARLYADYQDELNRRQLFDPEGRSWAARVLLRSGQTRPFERLRRVFVDGFTDFTGAEHEILEILAQRVERLVISLPLEGEPRRRDLFAKSEKTLAELQRRHEVDVVALDRPPKPARPALAWIERNLFRSPASATPASATRRSGTPASATPGSETSPGGTSDPAPALDGVELIVAASARAEIESIAARIKRLLATGDSRPADGPAPGTRAGSGGAEGSAAATGVPCGEILVVFRSLDSVEELVREVFREYGIPLAMESGRPLARAGLLSAITSLLRIEFEDWPYRELLAALANGYLRPTWVGAEGPEARRAAVALARRLQVARSRQDLLAQAARWANRLQRRAPTIADPDESASRDRERAAARLGLQFLEQLAALLRAIPERASAAGWADALGHLAGQAGLMAPETLGNDPGLREPVEDDPVEGASGRDKLAGDNSPGDNSSGDDPIDVLAWDAAMAALGSVERLGGWIEQPARQLDRAQFWTLWQDLLRIEPLPNDGDEAGRVRVLAAPAARGLAADYVFLAGLGEQSFPAAEGARSLLSDGDVAALVAAGLPLPVRMDRSRDEMLLFYEAITRPRRGLFLSYAALDAKAQPLMPSPYLYELAELCGDRWPRRQGALHLSPLPEHAEPLCLRDLRLMAVARAAGGAGIGGGRSAGSGGRGASGSRAERSVQGGNVSLLAELLCRDDPQSASLLRPAPRGARTGDRSGLGMSAVSRNIRRGLLVHEERRRAGYGAFEGLLLSDAARAALAARYGPESLWSASQLEQYAVCPFEFFLRRVLRIEPLEDLELAVDRQRRGLALHGVLADLHRRANDRSGGPAPLGSEEETLADAAELLRELSTPRADDTPLERALGEIDRRLLTTAIERYVKQTAKYAARLARTADDARPAHFEVAFGAGALESAEAPAADALSTSAPFRFDCGEETVLLRGRIDRIDIGTIGDSLVFNVLDYKSGKSGHLGKNAVDEGLALQLPLYALAAAELLLADRQAAPLEAGYWFLKGAGYSPALICHEASEGRLREAEAWLDLRRQLAEWVLAAARGVRNGYFPVFSRDDDCTSRCDFRTVCRINQARALDKIWTPPEAGGAQQAPSHSSSSPGSSSPGAPPPELSSPELSSGESQP